MLERPEMARESKEEILAERMLKDGKSIDEVIAASGKSRAVIEAMLKDIENGRA